MAMRMLRLCQKHNKDVVVDLSTVDQRRSCYVYDWYRVGLPASQVGSVEHGPAAPKGWNDWSEAERSFFIAGAERMSFYAAKRRAPHH